VCRYLRWLRFSRVSGIFEGPRFPDAKVSKNIFTKKLDGNMSIYLFKFTESEIDAIPWDKIPKKMLCWNTEANLPALPPTHMMVSLRTDPK
jgi:hypothetical protein